MLVSTHYMDEAERCHRLGYIAYGQLLASGTAQQIVAEQRLHTWEIRGADLHGLAPRLQQLPGAELVASFGTALHVSGRDGAQLQTALNQFIAGSPWQMHAIEPSLEDAFIHLMQGAQDPSQPRP